MALWRYGTSCPCSLSRILSGLPSRRANGRPLWSGTWSGLSQAGRGVRAPHRLGLLSPSPHPQTRSPAGPGPRPSPCVWPGRLGHLASALFIVYCLKSI